MRGVWVMFFVIGACVFAAPCFAQGPDQGPVAGAPGLGGGVGPFGQGPGGPFAQLRPGTRAWGPEQATGAPDTDRAGDIPTAWASLNPDGGVEWLQVDFDQAVAIAEVRIRESFNPGAVSKVAVILQNGKEHVLWEGFDPTAQAPEDFVVKAQGDVVGKTIKVYLDSNRVEGWNEIDAVELVAKDGKRQWASRAMASSTYAVGATGAMMAAGDGVVVETLTRPDGTRTGQVYYGPVRDPFAAIVQKRVIVHLEGDKSLEGTLVRSAGGFLVIEQRTPNEPQLMRKTTLIVNMLKIIYLETVE